MLYRIYIICFMWVIFCYIVWEVMDFGEILGDCYLVKYKC